jgi:dihydroorotate dehydrogenase
MDGVIATNTTISRAAVDGLPNAEQAGGLSGAPLFASSTEVLRQLSVALAGEVPIIGVGGILRGDDAAAKIAAGASLVQIYTGFIYRGPDLVAEAARAVARRRRR